MVNRVPIALPWYDFTLTLATEYRRIWQREFSGATLVYFSMRYIAVIERIVLVIKAFVLNTSEKVRFSSYCHDATWALKADFVR